MPGASSMRIHPQGIANARRRLPDSGEKPLAATL
jgi:hypothetical protein